MCVQNPTMLQFGWTGPTLNKLRHKIENESNLIFGTHWLKTLLTPVPDSPRVALSIQMKAEEQKLTKLDTHEQKVIFSLLKITLAVPCKHKTSPSHNFRMFCATTFLKQAPDSPLPPLQMWWNRMVRTKIPPSYNWINWTNFQQVASQNWKGI